MENNPNSPNKRLRCCVCGRFAKIQQLDIYFIPDSAYTYEDLFYYHKTCQKHFVPPYPLKSWKTMCSHSL